MVLLPAIILPAGLFYGCEKPHPDNPPAFVRYQENLVLKSKILNREVTYSVLLPPEYEYSKENFPVVYLLHGYGDNPSAWYEGGRIKYHSDRDHEKNGPMIFVMPQGFNSYYVNKYNGSFPYMDMFINELIPHIDSVFRTRKGSQYRAVMGYSMGGYGALVLPSLHPEKIETGVLLSMSFRTDQQYIEQSQDGWNSQFGSVFGGYGMSGTGRLTPYFKSLSPFHYFEQEELSEFKSLRFYIDCGDDEESLHITNAQLHLLMLEKGLKHIYRIRDGGHSWDYWQGSLRDALDFIGSRFAGKEYLDTPAELPPYPSPGENQYKSLDAELSGQKPGLFLPGAYFSGTDSLRLIYLFHDFDHSSAETALKEIYALLEAKMTSGIIPPSALVEIPCLSDIPTEEEFRQVGTTLSGNYRIKKEPACHAAIGIGSGAETLSFLVSRIDSMLNSCIWVTPLVRNIEESNFMVRSYFLESGQSPTFEYSFNQFVDLSGAAVPSEMRVKAGNNSVSDRLSLLDSSDDCLAKLFKK